MAHKKESSILQKQLKDIMEQKNSLQTEVDTLNLQIENLNSELLKEHTAATETKVSLYHNNNLCACISPASPLNRTYNFFNIFYYS